MFARNSIRALLLALGTLAAAEAVAFAEGMRGDAAGRPVVRRAERVGRTPVLTSLAGRTAERAVAAREVPREIPRRDIGPIRPRRPAMRETAAAFAPAAAPPALQTMPGPLRTFEGVGNIDGVYPPDPNIDVGPNHIVEMVNLHFCVYDKATGTNLIAPMRLSQLFAAGGFGWPAGTTDDGDPIVLYDHLADRWLLSQFIVSVTPCHEVVAISQTPDPTGAWYLYDFVMPNMKMNDYPHFGVWPDAYYMSDNQFDYWWAGGGVFAFDRARMLAGDSEASYVFFDLYEVDPNYGGLLPADLDGPAPAPGTSGLFAMIDDSWINPFDALYLWEFHVDWAQPTNSHFGRNGHPDYTNVVAEFDSNFGSSRSNISQPDTWQGLDAIADRLMHRLQFRVIGSEETLTACHTVDENGTNHAGVRYYHLRRAEPGLFDLVEQATHAPDSDHRWMGSAAVDRYGNLAVGYSVSGTGTYPSIRYAGRLATDPSGGLWQGEASLHVGAGSQTGSGARWGDYTALVVDPVDGVTFWYVNEYLAETSYADWHTRIGSFRLGAAEVGLLTGVVTNAWTGAGVTGAFVTASNVLSTRTAAGGAYALMLPTGIHRVAASASDYFTGATAVVSIGLGATTAQNFGMSPVPLRVAPSAGLTADGMEGGPFAPGWTSYVLTNAAAAALTWTTVQDVAWVSLSASGGVLAPGQGFAVTAAFNRAADFLPAASYTGRLVFSNGSGVEAHARPFRLRVSAYADTVLSAGFDAGLPPGWTVVTNNHGAAGWQFDDPAWRGNLTGGEGIFAIADSDWYPGVPMDTELRTPVVSLAGSMGAQIRFRTSYRVWSDEIADVDVSLHGAAGPWSNLWRRTNESVVGLVSVPAPVADGATNAMFRFHYHNAMWEWWWQVDDPAVVIGRAETGALAVAPFPGLEAAGGFPGPYAPNRLYRLTNTSGSALAWTSQLSQTWVSASPRGGQLAAGAATNVRVWIAASASNLLPGTHVASIMFSNRSARTAVARPVTLTVQEPLEVWPAAPFVSSGFEGGPFMPSGTVWRLTNQSSLAMAWTSSWNGSDWLAFAPKGGVLAAGEAVEVTCAAKAPALTVPGTHAGRLVFSNRLTAATFPRAATATVVEITGELSVQDSVPPATNFAMDFGVVTAGAPRVEHVTVRNDHATRTLVVQQLFFGMYLNVFDDPSLLGWREDVDLHWRVADGWYAASNAAADFMTTLFTNGVWADVSWEAPLWSDGPGGWSGGLALRATADADVDGTGSAYLFLVSEDYFSVYLMNSGRVSPLQEWTHSPSLREGGTNVLRATAQGAVLRLFLNGTFVWQGTNTTLASGNVGLAGYSRPSSPTVHRFDRTWLAPPTEPLVAIGRKQLYLNGNAQPGSDPRRAGKMPPAAASDTAEPASARPLSLTESSPLTNGFFSVSNAPAWPATLAPGQSFTVDVAYAPSGVASNFNVLSLQSNDHDEPLASLLLGGRPAAGVLTGRVTAAHDSSPLAGARVTVYGRETNWTAATDDGRYGLRLPVGVYRAECAAANYATGVATLAIHTDHTTTNDWGLAGSLLTYGPPTLTRIVRHGTVDTNALRLTNSGPLQVQYRIHKLHCGPGNAPVSSAGVLCYGLFQYGYDQRLLARFQSDDPGTLIPIAVYEDLEPTYFCAADFLNGDSSTLYVLEEFSGALIRFDTATGARTVIATLPSDGSALWTGMAGDPTDGRLYLASNDDGVSRLHIVDPATGALTFIGDITGVAEIASIAIDLEGRMFGLDNGSDILVRIDKRSGAATVVGPIGFDAWWYGGLDFDEASGILYLAADNGDTVESELRVVDPETGASELVGYFGSNEVMSLAVATLGDVRPWAVIPASTGTVAAAGTATPDLLLDASVLPPGPSTNCVELTFFGTFVNAVPPMWVTMIVTPDELLVTPTNRLEAAGPLGGPFAPAEQTYHLANTGGLTFAWILTTTGGWIATSATGGVLNAGGSLDVTVRVDEAAAAFRYPGTHSDTLVFANLATGARQIRPARLDIAAPAPETVYAFPLEEDPGWSREGQWALGPPLGAQGDPAAGRTGSNVFGYNLAGTYTDNMPACHLTTLPLDFGGWTGVTLRFWRWLGVDRALQDKAGIQVSANFAPWSTVWTHSVPSVAILDMSWREFAYPVPAADGATNVRVRWSMGPTDYYGTNCGWNLDDIAFTGYRSAARIGFDPPSAATVESAGAVTLAVVRLPSLLGPVSAGFATADGTALAGKDYVAATGALAFANGQRTNLIVLTLRDNAETNAARTFFVLLRNLSSNATFAAATSTVTIADDESAPPPAVDILAWDPPVDLVQHEFASFASQVSAVPGHPVTSLAWASSWAGPFHAGPMATVLLAAAGAQTVTLAAVDDRSTTGRAALALTVLADTDADGLPDGWETAHWPAGDSGGPLADRDGDGYNNREEWLAGTDPTNAASALRLRVLEWLDDGFVLGADAATNRRYTWQWARQCNLVFQPIATNAPPYPEPAITLTDRVFFTYTNGCYRLRVGR